uniref:GHMP kinase N-terminal domain-containing protein n=1 Tax=Roseihalotalea indica TaxID=2867963 RepID=A0AA49GL53_9BACT|nr:hypothetical protein K4G66_28560 [Tunicatimonas sp. TK19036]
MKRIAGILKDFFALHQQKVVQATAPGRLDIMGGFTDFAGGLLLQKPLDQPSTAYLAVTEAPTLRLQYYFQSELIATFESDYSTLLGQFNTLNYDFIHEQILKLENGSLLLPIISSIILFFEKKNIKREGIDLVIVSELPVGKGVGSMASYEVAALRAMAEWYNAELLPTELPGIALQAENLLAKIPTGGAGQFASFSFKNQALTVFHANPPEIFHSIDIPDAIHFIGIETGAPVSPQSAQYEAVRAATFMGYTIIALASGATLHDLEVAKSTGNWSALPFEGNVGRINPSEFEDKYLHLLPESMSGDEFYHTYKITMDTVSFIDRDRTYAIRTCTKHPVYESFRVKLFAQIVKNYSTEFQDYSNRLSLLGELMFQSHQSYSDCGLGHEDADWIVQRVKDIGPKKGLYGARITDTGAGGTVCVLCSGITSPEHVASIHEELQQKLGRPLAYFE